MLTLIGLSIILALIISIGSYSIGQANGYTTGHEDAMSTRITILQAEDPTIEIIRKKNPL